MKKRSRTLRVSLCLCLLAAGVCMFLQSCQKPEQKSEGEFLEEYRDSLRQYKTVSLSSDEITFDFDALREENPDIYAWIEIPGTNVDYPVLQSASDDEVYLYTACDGSSYVGGSVFTQASYNGTDFNDPVTLLYGNTMQDGTMFGELQATYSGMSGGEEYRAIKVYLPEEVRHYTVFAAVPYDNTHILYTYDFTNKYWYGNFFSNIKKIRSIGAFFDEEAAPVFGDRVIILSTSLMDGSDGRFLVMAVLHEEIAGDAGDLP